MKKEATSGETVTINNVLYFIINDTKIIISEHFPEQGQTLSDLLEGAVLYESRQFEMRK